jgi:hypothetical protein
MPSSTLGESVALHAVGEREQPSNGFRHQRRRAQPAETVGDLLLHGRIRAPYGRVAPPHAGRGAFRRVLRSGDDVGERSG